MLEFYYKFYSDKFKKKSELLLGELEDIFRLERITTKATDGYEIDGIYKEQLGEDLFTKLNNFYFTIRHHHANHDLLKRYLPEFHSSILSERLLGDFFCGAGGLSKGLANAGFQPAFANDINTEALETYYFNHHVSIERLYNRNIKELVDNYQKYKHFFKNIRLIAGGPPCQGFSTANRWNFELEESTNQKRFIDDDRNVLYKYFVKLLGLINPDFFIMENVRGMMKVEKQIEEDIKKETGSDYYFLPLLLDAQDYNIPQSRKRYILIGGKNFMVIEQIKNAIYFQKNENNPYRLSDALFGLPSIQTNPYKLNTSYNSDAHGHTIRKLRLNQNNFLKDINTERNINYLFNHKSRYNNANDLEIFKILPEGENSLHDSIQHLNNYTNRNHIFKDKYYKLKKNEVSKTITSHMKTDCHMYIHPEQARGLSPREAARIQTFPDDYFFRGNLNDWYSQIGNAVPVKLAEIIGKEIIKHI